MGNTDYCISYRVVLFNEKRGVMKLKEAIAQCHVRSAVYRKSKPDKKYYKNHTIKIIDRVPVDEQSANDWEEYDPRDDDDTSLFMYND